MPEPLTNERLAEIRAYSGDPMFADEMALSVPELLAEVDRLRAEVVQLQARPTQTGYDELDVRWQAMVRSHDNERRQRFEALAEVDRLRGERDDLAELLDRLYDREGCGETALLEAILPALAPHEAMLDAREAARKAADMTLDAEIERDLESRFPGWRKS